MPITDPLQQPDPVEPGENQALYDTIDAMCSSVSFLDNFPTSKQSKLIQFSVEFCDNYGVSKESVDVVLNAKMNDDGTRELFIEVAGILTETIVYDSEMVITNRVTASVAGAVIAASGGANPAGWFMAVAVGGAYYALGSVIATATSRAAGNNAKEAMANLWDTYISKTQKVNNEFKMVIPNTEEELFTNDELKDIFSSLPEGTTLNIKTNSETNLVLISINNENNISINNSKIFNPDVDTQTMKDWIKSVTSSGADSISIDGVKKYNIASDDNNLLIRNALDTIPSVSILLSHIDIFGGDKIDLGNKGIYTVKGGDTFSEIANANGFSTKELLQKNTWLIDEGKVDFDQDKVLIDVGDTNLNTNIHTIIGDANASNLLRDLNGGNDTLIGGSKNDILEGGSGSDILKGQGGFDTYYSDSGDIITDDSTGGGIIYFDNNLLSGEKIVVKDTNGYMYEDSQYSYVLDNPNGIGKLTILEGTNATGFTGKEIYVNNFDATKEGGYLGIIFTKKEIEITVEDSIVLEGGDLEFRVNINQALDKDLVLSVDSYFSGSAESSDITMPSDKTITILAGQTTATYKVATVDDEKEEPTENFIFAVTGIDSSNGYEGVDAYKGNDLGEFTIKNAGTGTIEDNDEAGTVYVSIGAVSNYEGNWDDNNQLSFVVKASRALKDDESATVDLNIYDIDTDSSDYGFLSEDTITFDSTHQQFVITLDIFGDETSTCRELKIANNISTCSLDIEQIQQNKEVA